jgi:Arc/MetJ-type ribon-helix-helix transcriptional regulator
MKQKISISIGEENLKKVEELLKQSRFRNKSHVLEYALEKMLEDENDDQS